MGYQEYIPLFAILADITLFESAIFAAAFLIVRLACKGTQMANLADRATFYFSAVFPPIWGDFKRSQKGMGAP
jgi:hypothetical protein